MSFKVEILKDSKSECGSRITTMQLRYPRFIHSEFMTHRVFSRNASSSRAIPVSRLIQDIIDDTAMPIHWGKNIPGMQAKEENTTMIFLSDLASKDHSVTVDAKTAWLRARDSAIEFARAHDYAGYHKQIVNRILEPFSHINVVVTATDWDNFFNLRAHPDAQPEFRELAYMMKDALEENEDKVNLLDNDEWHLPYVILDEDISEISKWALDNLTYKTRHLFQHVVNYGLTQLSTSRCARVSYLTHDLKKPTVEKDLELYRNLVVSKPLHASPAEHQARPSNDVTSNKLNGNFSPYWSQNRKGIERLINLDSNYFDTVRNVNTTYDGYGHGYVQNVFKEIF